MEPQSYCTTQFHAVYLMYRMNVISLGGYEASVHPTIHLWGLGLLGADAFNTVLSVQDQHAVDAIISRSVYLTSKHASEGTEVGPCRVNGQDCRPACLKSRRCCSIIHRPTVQYVQIWLSWVSLSPR